RFRRDARLHLAAGDELDVVDREDVGGIRHGHREAAPRAGDRNRLELVRDVGGKDPRQRWIGIEVAEVDRWDSIELGEELGEIVFCNGADLDECAGQIPASGLDLELGLLQGVGRNEARFQQLEADVLLLHGGPLNVVRALLWRVPAESAGMGGSSIRKTGATSVQSTGVTRNRTRGTAISRTVVRR